MKKNEKMTVAHKRIFDRKKNPPLTWLGTEAPLIKNNTNAEYFPPLEKENIEPSKTVPEQTMSIREILERSRRGLSTGGQKVPIYNGEDHDFPDLSKLDLAERQEVLENAENELADLTEKIKQSKADPDKKIPIATEKKPNNDSQALGTIPTDVKSGDKAEQGPKP